MSATADLSEAVLERVERQLMQTGFDIVRLRQQTGDSAAFTLRHGSFPSKPKADARAKEFARLGLAPRVVQVR